MLLYPAYANATRQNISLREKLFFSVEWNHKISFKVTEESKEKKCVVKFVMKRDKKIVLWKYYTQLKMVKNYIDKNIEQLYKYSVIYLYS